MESNDPAADGGAKAEPKSSLDASMEKVHPIDDAGIEADAGLPSNEAGPSYDDAAPNSEDAAGLPPAPPAPDAGPATNDLAVEDNGSTDSAPPVAVCGNGIIESGELCDSDNFNGQSCSAFGYDAGQIQCASDCGGYELQLCFNYPTSYCGDGKMDVGEQCDSSDFGGLECKLLGHDGGKLRCNQDCTLDETDCHSCGDNIRNGTEVCDGILGLGLNTCKSLGYDGGTLGCNLTCSAFNITNCYYQAAQCGDNIRNGTEVCDGILGLGLNTCKSLGFDGGTLGCNLTCSAFNTANCYYQAAQCGNNQAEQGEACDGTDLNSATCESLGEGHGTVSCKNDCSGFNVKNCVF